MQSAKGSTALMWAARRGDDDVVTELLGKKGILNCHHYIIIFVFVLKEV